MRAPAGSAAPLCTRLRARIPAFVTRGTRQRDFKHTLVDLG